MSVGYIRIWALWIVGMAMPCWLCAGSVFDLDFTADEGFVNGSSLNDQVSMNSQPNWVASDVNGAGYASYAGGWQRARNFTDFSLEVGESVVIETILRLTAPGSIDANIYTLGFAEELINSGGATPSIGSILHMNSDGSYWVGASSAEQQVLIPASYGTDWIKIVQTITRRSTAGQFGGVVSVSNVTAGVDLGSSSVAWTQSTSDGSWGGVMNASFRGTHSPGVPIEIDRWTVSTVAPPETISIEVDATRTRSIGGVGALDRYAWFGVYHEAGFGNKQVDGKRIDEWIWEEGQLWPSRGTIGFSQFTEDPLRDGFIDPSSIQDFTGGLSRYVTALGYDPNHKTVFSGRGHGDHPDFMCWPTNLTSGVRTVSNHVAHGEAVVRVFDRISELGGLMPLWYEVTNESTIPNNFGWHFDADAWDKLAAYHLGVSDAIDASVYSNSVKVAGPVDAYPYRDGNSGDFSAWTNKNQSFVHQTGDKLDAYAMHVYEQSNGKSSYEDHLELFQIWHLGRLPAFLDLWENEQVMTWGSTLPFVISEYGLLDNPGGDSNAFYQVRSYNGILLSLLDRPDVIDKMSAFLPSYAPYDLASDRVLFKSEDGGSTYAKTSYFEYLRFWRDLKGDYLFTNTDNPHVLQHAFLDGNTNLYLVVQNNYNTGFEVDVNIDLPAGASVVSAEVQRLYEAGNDIARAPFSPVADLSQVPIAIDEIIMVRIAVSGLLTLPVWEETNHYGDRNLVPMQTGVAENFSVTLPTISGSTHSAGELHIGLYAFAGFNSGLQSVSVNGTLLSGIPDLSYSAGAPRYWTQISLPISESILQAGVNTISVVPAEGESLMKITSVRLTSEQATDAVLNADRDLDGMSDAWEIAYGFEPADPSDGALDSDLDGFDNAAEYQSGTNPFNSQSYLSVAGSMETGSGYKISFNAVSNRIYTIESSVDLQLEWSEWTNGILGDNSVMEFYNLEVASNQFYRLKVETE
jgi:agarase